jgi:hypothetical protein
MNRHIICSLLSTFAGVTAAPAPANDNAIFHEPQARAVAGGQGYSLAVRPHGVPRLKSRKQVFVQTADRSARSMPPLRLLIARPR